MFIRGKLTTLCYETSPLLVFSETIKSWNTYDGDPVGILVDHIYYTLLLL